jgi:hypothetical protein
MIRAIFFLLVFFSVFFFSCGNEGADHYVSDTMLISDSMQKVVDSTFKADSLHKIDSLNDIYRKEKPVFGLSPADSAKVADSINRTRNTIRDFD